MQSRNIRKKFKAYFESQDHKWIKSSSLIPKNDPSLLFVNAGMNQFKNCFLNLEKPLHPRAISIQKCLRAGGKHNDLEEVGSSLHHHTFFEMMGNFSFGSCTKKDAVYYAWEFLTKELYIPKEQLWVSVFKEDKESADIWKKQQNIPEQKILHLSKKSNFWRMGDIGPCGPCSEIYFNPDPKNQNPKEEELVEIWNLVFMSFNEDGQGHKTPLSKPGIDTGMGLERISMLLQAKTSNYDTDLFKDIILDLEKNCNKKYLFKDLKTQKDSSPDIQKAFRVLADHSRAVGFLISDGVLPGADGASYVLRRLLRRAFFYSGKLSENKNLLEAGVLKAIDLFQEFYPELAQNKNLIVNTIREEHKKFTQNLKIGKKILMEKMKSLSHKTLDKALIWDLYSTYGFPVDLTRLIAQEQGFTVNEINLKDFTKTSSAGRRIKEKPHHLLNNLVETAQSSGQLKTIKTCYTADKINSKILSSIDSWVLIDKTCFYPEGGGPIGDQGILETKTGKAHVLDTQERVGFVFHKIKIIEGEIKKEQECQMQVDKEFRSEIAVSHSATHLLHQALREVLGKHIKQKGSLVKPGELRFDFSHPHPLDDKQLQKIEEQVQHWIQTASSVSAQTLPYKTALNQGALFMAGENYADQVRVIKMGASIELCGGIHVKNTQDIEIFKIIAETGVQAGVRRLLAYTNNTAKKWLKGLAEQNRELIKYLNIPSQQNHNNKNPFISWWTKQDNEIKEIKKQFQKLNFKSLEQSRLNNANSLKNIKLNSAAESTTDLARQNLEFRKYIKLPIPKIQDIHERRLENENPFIPLIKKKQAELSSLKEQFQQMAKTFDMEKIKNQVKNFEIQNIKGRLLVIKLPLSHQKILAELADKLQSQIPQALIVLLGESPTASQYPLITVVAKELQPHILAGDLLKNTIAPLLRGKGGGKARFAQGVMTDKTAFAGLSAVLLKKFS